MLNVTNKPSMLSSIVLGVVILNVVAPTECNFVDTKSHFNRPTQNSKLLYLVPHSEHFIFVVTYEWAQ